MRASPADRLQHIKDAIGLIQSLVQAHDDAALKTDIVKWLALERLFEIVSEATRHIDKQDQNRHAGVPWIDIASLGNRLRHGYDSIDKAILLSIARHQLGSLENAIDALITGNNRSED